MKVTISILVAFRHFRNDRLVELQVAVSSFFFSPKIIKIDYILFYFLKSFILPTDASGIAVGGILSQREINKDRPIAYASQILTDNEIKYEKEYT